MIMGISNTIGWSLVSDSNLSKLGQPHIIFYYGFDFMLRTGLHLDINTETFFLACDLYQRTIRILNIDHNNTELELDPESIDWRNVSCLTLVCIWISLKIVQDTYLTAEDIVILGSERFEEELVLTMEQNIVESLQGVLYRYNLYSSSSNCHHKMVEAFNELHNVFSYQYIEPEIWSLSYADSCPFCNKSNTEQKSRRGPISFSWKYNKVSCPTIPSKLAELYPKTKYYTYANNDMDEYNHIRYLFETDLSKYQLII